MNNALIDNDIIFKSVSYNLTEELLSSQPLGADNYHVLMATTFMLKKKLQKRPPSRGAELALAELNAIIEKIHTLEPTQEEVALAADLEYWATQSGQELDGGESLLCAILVIREWPHLFTGDKRAIFAIEALVNEKRLDISTKVTCFEQLITHLLQTYDFEEVRAKICAEASTDKALTNCFGCRSAQTSVDSCQEGLDSYINAIRAQAARVLSNPIKPESDSA